MVVNETVSSCIRQNNDHWDAWGQEIKVKSDQQCAPFERIQVFYGENQKQ